jgi:hypothetical protein
MGRLRSSVAVAAPLGRSGPRCSSLQFSLPVRGFTLHGRDRPQSTKNFFPCLTRGSSRRADATTVPSVTGLSRQARVWVITTARTVLACRRGAGREWGSAAAAELCADVGLPLSTVAGVLPVLERWGPARRTAEGWERQLARGARNRRRTRSPAIPPSAIWPIQPRAFRRVANVGPDAPSGIGARRHGPGGSVHGGERSARRRRRARRR